MDSSSLAYNLPPEVVTLIWGFCDRDSRILELVDTPAVCRQTFTPPHPDQRLPLLPPTKVIRTLLPRKRLSIGLHGPKVPILMRLNRETREIAKRRFILLALMDMVDGRKYWFDPENDTFAIMNNWASIFDRNDNEMLQKVKRFAFLSREDRGYECPRPFDFNFRQLVLAFCVEMPIFPGQREYTLLLKDKDAGPEDCAEIVKGVLNAVESISHPIVDTRPIVQSIYDAREGPTMEKHSIAFRVDTKERFFGQVLNDR